MFRHKHTPESRSQPITREMKVIPEERQIYISARLWHEIQPKVRLAPFVYALHDGIDLSKYGAGLKKFFFTFLILRPERMLFTPGTYFDKEKRSAEIAVQIDYDKVEKASKEEVIKMMEDAYLEGIGLIATLPLPDEFDVDAFKEDVKAIFSVEKWYELVMEPNH